MLMALVESDKSSEYDRYEEVHEKTQSICHCLRTADVYSKKKKNDIRVLMRQKK